MWREGRLFGGPVPNSLGTERRWSPKRSDRVPSSAERSRGRGYALITMKNQMNLMGNMGIQNLGMGILTEPLPCGLKELDDLIYLLDIE